MILELTKNEQITILGILEDLAQAEDINTVFPIQARIEIISIIQKLGGTNFGKIDITKIRKYILSSTYGRSVSEDNNG